MLFLWFVMNKDVCRARNMLFWAVLDAPFALQTKPKRSKGMKKQDETMKKLCR